MGIFTPCGLRTCLNELWGPRMSHPLSLRGATRHGIAEGVAGMRRGNPGCLEYFSFS